MRRLFCLLLVVTGLCISAFSATAESRDASLRGCAEHGLADTRGTLPGIQLADSSCRSNCRSRRGYCMSTCRDSQCRAICSDLYQSCVSSCR